MIFVTVGTHEQPFNRLIKEIDDLKKDGTIKEDVFMQTGFSTYEPKYCEYKKMLSYPEMNEKVKEARIAITHGGPASFIAPLQIGKIPIVVPRQKQYDEHVNNHQVNFAKAVKERYNSIIVIEDIKDLENTIKNYDEISSQMKENYKSNNEKFCEEFTKIVEELLTE